MRQWPAAEQGLMSKGTELVSVMSKGTKLVRVTINGTRFEISSFHRRLISGLPYSTETKKTSRGALCNKKNQSSLNAEYCIADGDKRLSKPFILAKISTYLS